MNKSDIMKAAELSAPYATEGKIPQRDARKAIRALQAVAELLKQVEVLPEGSEPMVGDVLLSPSGNPFISTGKASDSAIYQNKIIQRNGKPVIIDKEGV